MISRKQLTRSISLSVALCFLFSVSAVSADVCVTESELELEPSTPSNDFNVHPNGTVTQKSTGLMWMRCPLGTKFDGTRCTGRVPPISWMEAQKAGLESRYAGYNDWRLPEIDELKSIVEHSCQPALNHAVFPADGHLSQGFYWSNTSVELRGTRAWNVHFGTGRHQLSRIQFRDQHRVRLVRDIAPVSAMPEVQCAAVADEEHASHC